MGPGRTSTVHGCLVRQGGCGWPDFTTDDKRQNETTAQTQDDSNTGVGSDKLKHGSGAGDDVRPGVFGMTHGVRLVCGFVGTGRRVTGGPGDEISM